MDLRFHDKLFNVIEKAELCPACQNNIACDIHYVTCAKVKGLLKRKHE